MVKPTFVLGHRVICQFVSLQHFRQLNIAFPYFVVTKRWIILAVHITGDSGHRQHAGTDIVRQFQATIACEIIQHPAFGVNEQHLHRQFWSFPPQQTFASKQLLSVCFSHYIASEPTFLCNNLCILTFLNEQAVM